MNADKQTSENRLAQICAAGMAVVAGLMRLIPHPWNFTPVGSLGLFGGARLRSWWAYALPLGIMAVSDLLLWGIRGDKPFNLTVYACFALTVLWGRLFLRTGSIWRIGIVSVLVSIQFFLVTNFGAWWTLSGPLTLTDGTLMAPLYTRDLSGLVACYVAALPFAGTNAPPLGFFGNQLAGDLFYTAILFGAYALLRSGVLVPRRLTAARTS
jgi:hypothetical protein